MELMPATTAVLTMELQRGVCGDLAPTRHLADACMATGMLDATAHLLDTARRFGATVVHCTFTIRPDGRGTRFDIPLMTAARSNPSYLRQGDPTAELIPGIGPCEGDLVVERHHGVSPFTGTDLDVLLRHLGITTVVVTGVSLNIGVIGAVIEAVDLGYRVVVPRDTVVGLPLDHGSSVLRHAVAYLAEVTTVEELTAPWAGRTST
jgi:nicotinamidase-related amidase